MPYSWLYLSKAYIIFAVAIPAISLIIGVIFNATVVALSVCLCEVVFLLILVYEVKKL